MVRSQFKINWIINRRKLLGENRLIQKRKTMQVDWEKCFDVGILQGRVLQVLLLFEKAPIADATMRLEASIMTKRFTFCFEKAFPLFLRKVRGKDGRIISSINKTHYVIASMKR